MTTLENSSNTNFNSTLSTSANIHTPVNNSIDNGHNSKADKKADALKTPAHRTSTDARFEEDARDLHRILPASQKVY